MKNKIIGALFAVLLFAGLSSAAGNSDGGRFYASGNPKKAEFALTFDDGPGFITEDLLALLKKRGVKATFFVLGSSARTYPQRVKDIVAGGHLVASHTDTHKNWFRLGKSENREQLLIEELKNASDAIFKACGVRPSVLRMPNGYNKPWARKVALDYGYVMVNWTYGSDWTRQSEENMDAGYLKALRPGAILLMHDGGGKNKVKNLRLVAAVLDEAQKKGLKAVRIDDMFGMNDPKKK